MNVPSELAHGHFLQLIRRACPFPLLIGNMVCTKANLIQSECHRLVLVLGVANHIRRMIPAALRWSLFIPCALGVCYDSLHGYGL